MNKWFNAYTLEVWTETGKRKDDGDDELVQLTAPTANGGTRFQWVSQGDLEDAWFIVNE